MPPSTPSARVSVDGRNEYKKIRKSTTRNTAFFASHGIFKYHQLVHESSKFAAKNGKRSVEKFAKRRGQRRIPRLFRVYFAAPTALSNVRIIVNDPAPSVFGVREFTARNFSHSKWKTKFVFRVIFRFPPSHRQRSRFSAVVLFAIGKRTNVSAPRFRAHKHRNIRRFHTAHRRVFFHVGLSPSPCVLTTNGVKIETHRDSNEFNKRIFSAVVCHIIIVDRPSVVLSPRSFIFMQNATLGNIFVVISAVGAWWKRQNNYPIYIIFFLRNYYNFVPYVCARFSYKNLWINVVRKYVNRDWP